MCKVAMETIPARRIGRGEALIKSVSLFVTSGRKASVAAAAAAAAWKSRTERQDAGVSVKEARSRKMGDEAKCLPRIVEALKRNTHFSRQETEALVRVYQKLVASSADVMAGQATGSGQVTLLTSAGAAPSVCEGLDRVVFRELLHNAFDLVTEDVLMDRIFCAFDRTCCGSVRLEDWMSGLSVFLRGTLEERTAFCFLVYDLNNDGFITRDEMFSLLKNCLMKQPGDEDPDEGVKDLVELVLRKLDTDRDGKISFQDFKTAVREERLLLEAFGLCLPSEGACQTFMATLCS